MLDFFGFVDNLYYICESQILKPISIMYQQQVSFGDAVKRALTVNYCNFNGRSSRSEYWWYVLATFILGMVVGLIFGSQSTIGSIVNGVVGLALFLPGLGLCVRRLHDIGKSGWLVLLAFIPLVGAIILIIWFAKESEMAPNQYGPVPNMVQ